MNDAQSPSVSDAGIRLGVSGSTVKRMCRDGELAWFRTRGPHGHIRVLAESVEKFRQEFCAEAAVLLRAVKIAWRNPTMHVENVYDEEKALDVLNSVKGFMRHLATRLSESKEMLERGSQ